MTMRTVTRRAFFTLTIGASAAALSGCRRAWASGMRSPAGRTLEQLDVAGVTRRYVRYAPPGLPEHTPVPLLLVLHGRGGSGAIAEWMYGMSALAAAQGFVVAYPDALGDPPTWHAGVGMGGHQDDDVAFVRALVERESNARPIDPARTFVCGHSSGGMMSYRLAAEASDLFPAVGVVAGAAGFQLPNGRTGTLAQPAHPVSIIHIHGTDDRLMPYSGGQREGPGSFLGAAASVNLWVAANGCDPTPNRETVGVAHRETYSGGRASAEVTLWTITGGGHEWPKINTMQRPAAGISATEQIWTFFAAHPRGVLNRTS